MSIGHHNMTPASNRASGAKRKPPGPPSDRRQRRSAEIRERLFRSALGLFAKKGFFSTTVEDITEAADVGKGTFFNYFPSKEHVLTVLHDIQIGKVERAVQAAHTGKEEIRKILRHLMDHIAEEPARSQPLAR